MRPNLRAREPDQHTDPGLRRAFPRARRASPRCEHRETSRRFAPLVTRCGLSNPRAHTARRCPCRRIARGWRGGRL